MFVRRHLPIAAKIVQGKLERIEKPLIPFESIREALINAICHKDYSDSTGSVGIAIYDNRMEIFNNGGLLKGLTLEKIKSGYSKPRNPLIADVLYKSQLIEKWGRGIQEIIKSCIIAGDPEPEFISDQYEFKVVFEFPKSMNFQTPVGQITDYDLKSLTARQREIIHILSQKDEMKLSEIMEKLISPPAERTLRDDLAKLRKLELIASTGHAKTAVWYLVKHES